MSDLAYPYEAKATLKYRAPPGTAEPIAFQPGEVVTVLAQADDDGDWLRGKTAAGQEGVFPASFLTRVESAAATQEPEASPEPAAAPVDDAPSTSPPTAAKSNSLKDRIAFLNQQGSAAPPPKPKPTFAKRSVASPPPQLSSQASALAPSAAPTTSTGDEAGAGMSAADAAASISKGGSLRERIAALQAQQAAMGGDAKPAAPPKPAGKVWKRPAAPEPEPESEEAAAEGAAAPSSPKEPTRSASMLSAASDAKSTAAGDAENEETTVPEVTSGEPEEMTEEDIEAQRKEDLRRRMASLSGSGGGTQLGGGAVKMPALPKRAAGPQKRKKEAAPVVATPNSSAAPDAPEGADPNAATAVNASDGAEDAATQSTDAVDEPATTQEVTEDASASIAPAVVKPIVPAALSAASDDEDGTKAGQDDDDDDFETPSLPTGSAAAPSSPPLAPSRPAVPVPPIADELEDEEKGLHETDEKEETASPTSSARPPIPTMSRALSSPAADDEEAPETPAEAVVPTSPARSVPMPPLPGVRPPAPVGRPPIPLMATRPSYDDEPVREIPPMPSAASEASNVPSSPPAAPLPVMPPPARPMPVPVADDDENDEPETQVVSEPVTNEKSVEEAQGTEEEKPTTEDRDAEEEGDEEEEDPEVARRRAIAARMAKLGGRAGPMMGMPPPFGALMPPRKQRSVDPAEEPASTKDSEEEPERQAPRRMPGMPVGGVLMPGFVPPVRRPTTEDDAPPISESLSTEETPQAAPSSARDAQQEDDGGEEEERPPLPPSRPPPVERIPAEEEEGTGEAEAPPLPPGRPPLPPPPMTDSTSADDLRDAPARALPPPPPGAVLHEDDTPNEPEEPNKSEAVDRVPTPPSRRPSTQLPPPPSPGRANMPAAGLTKRSSVRSVGSSSSRKASLDAGRSPSMDLSASTPLMMTSEGGPCKAALGLDLMQDSAWWAQQPFSAPPSIAQRQDLVWEANVNKITKRGKTRFDNEIDVVFDDLSRVIVSVSYAEDSPTDGEVSHEAFSPPSDAATSVDVLMRLSTTLGAQIFAAAHSKLSDKARDLNDDKLVELCFSRAPDALPPIGSQGAYGIVVFATRGAGNKYEKDEPRAGDVAVFTGVKIKHGLSTTKVGQDRPHVAVVASWDAKKRKLHTIEAPPSPGQVTEEGYRVDDVKSGEVRVYRPIDRKLLDAASPIE